VRVSSNSLSGGTWRARPKSFTFKRVILLGELSIERAAEKSVSGRRLLAPLTTEARAVIPELRALNKLRKVPSTHVRVLRAGPWHGAGLGGHLVKGLAEGWRDEAFPDPRGIAATGFCMAPLTDEEVADIMGWEPDQVRTIRKRYVDRNRIAAGVIARMEKAQDGQD